MIVDRDRDPDPVIEWCERATAVFVLFLCGVAAWAFIR